MFLERLIMKKIKWLFSVALLTLGFSSEALYAADKDDFAKLYDDWTAAFNERDGNRICDIFAKKVVADFAGIPSKTYPTICASLKSMLQEPDRRYHYRYEFRNIYRSGNLAAIRLTWFFTTIENGRKSLQIEQGLDVLERNKAGKWEIVNWISYNEPDARK
jgi:ketosteroid isomerase-like protein